MANFIAIDLGASSGRVMLGRLDTSTSGPRIRLEEIRRFSNGPIRVLGHLHWDVLRLWNEILHGLRLYSTAHSETVAGIGVDSWAVDFGLLDDDGQLLGNPHHYRDERTHGLPELVDSAIAPRDLYKLTGIQRLPLNTIYQLASMRSSAAAQLGVARALLLVPDLVHYWLTGRAVTEYTNATTTQLIDVGTGEWANDLIETLGLPARIFLPLVQPGSKLGVLLPEVRDAAGLPARSEVPVFAVATHDTASAVAAIPGLDARSAYISSGTWSLVGIETREPILTDEARLHNFTNEGGLDGTYRFLRNVAGLWLLQECQRRWSLAGQTRSWDDLQALSRGAVPMRSLIDPDAPDFLSPSDMPAAIQDYCRRTGQPVPVTQGEIVRCCIDSLALRYQWVLEALERVSNRTIETVRIVGGGSQHSLLCQLTADVSGRRVVAGPVEATALGNLMIQAIGAGLIPDVDAGRSVVQASVQLTHYEPRIDFDVERAYDRFNQLVTPSG